MGGNSRRAVKDLAFSGGTILLYIGMRELGFVVSTMEEKRRDLEEFRVWSREVKRD